MRLWPRMKISRGKVLVALLLVVALLAAACGGGGGTDEGDESEAANSVDADSEETPAAGDEAEPVGSAGDDPEEQFAEFVAEMFNPTGTRELLDKFAVLSYRWENYEDSTLTDTIELHFQWLGETELEGETVDHLALKIDADDENESDSVEMWMRADGSVAKMLFSDGEEVPEMVQSLLANNMLSVLLMPFRQFDVLFRQAWDAGYLMVESQAVTRTQLAGYDATVHTFRGTGEIGEGGGTAQFELELAKFDGFELMTRGEVAGSESSKFVLIPLEIKLR